MGFETADIETFVRETGKWAENVFWKKEVLRAYGNNIRCYLHRTGQEVTGGFVGFETKIMGRRALITPPYMPNIGPIWRPREGKPVVLVNAGKKLLTSWAEFLKHAGFPSIELSLPPNVTDIQPVIWNNFGVQVRYTYRLDIDIGAEDIFNGFDDKLKSDLRKNESGKMLPKKITPDFENIHVIKSGLKNKKALAHQSILEKLVPALSENGAWLTEVNLDDQIVAQVMTVPSGTVAYYLFGGTTELGKSNSAGPVALFTAIKESQILGLKTFDFEGSMIPSVERYFRQFGGQPIPYFTVSTGMKPYKMLRKWMGKI